MFAFKHREVRAGRELLPSTLREKGDEQALAFKEFLGQMRGEARTWPAKLLVIGRVLARRAMLSLAVAARATERKAHLLADRLSHKHHFAPRESTNSFLRQVSDFKGGDVSAE